MTRRPMPLMSALMLSLGVLPPLPEPAPRQPLDDDDERDQFVKAVGMGEAEVVREPIALRPRSQLSPLFRVDPEPLFRVDPEPLPAPRPRRADPDRKAKRKAQAKARRKGRR